MHIAGLVMHIKGAPCVAYNMGPCDAYRLGKACYAFWSNKVFCQMDEFIGLVMHIAGLVSHSMAPVDAYIICDAYKMGLVMHIIGLVMHIKGAPCDAYNMGLVMHIIGLVMHIIGLVMHTKGAPCDAYNMCLVMHILCAL